MRHQSVLTCLEHFKGENRSSVSKRERERDPQKKRNAEIGGETKKGQTQRQGDTQREAFTQRKEGKEETSKERQSESKTDRQGQADGDMHGVGASQRKTDRHKRREEGETE